MTTKQPEFSLQDANDLIALVESAPLENMAQAKQVSALLGRFANWYNLKSAKRVRKAKETAK